MPYVNKDVPQFEGIRQRSQNRQLAQTNQADDALKRRFAAMGALNSGAMVKQQQQMLDNAARQGEEAQQGIDFAEAQERVRQDERGQDVGFRKDQFAFTKEEAAANRAMQKEQFDKQYALQEAQLSMDRDAQGFNMGMARDAQKAGNRGIVGSVLGGGGVVGTIGEVFGGGGKFFCTELFLRGLASQREMLKMCIFFFRCMWTDTSTCYFYAMNGHKIVAVANKRGFDWSSVKRSLIDDIIENMDAGHIQVSKLLYKTMIFKMCISFEETRDIYDPRSLETTMFDRLWKLPRLMFTKTFWRAFSIWSSTLKVRGAVWQ